MRYLIISLWKFDKVIAKILLLGFFPDTV